MTELEDRPTTSVPRAAADEAIPPIALLPRLAPEPSCSPSEFRRRSRFAVYFTKHGWVHVLLLLSVWLFLFPFFWMLATSVKTDEELMDAAILPTIEHFRPDSPYVRPAIEPRKPSDVPTSQWEQILPRLTDIASAAI